MPFKYTPGGIRTPDLLVRSQTLYPAELRAHSFFVKKECKKTLGILAFLFLQNICLSLVYQINFLNQAGWRGIIQKSTIFPQSLKHS